MAYSSRINDKKIKLYRLKKRLLPLILTAIATGALCVTLGANGKLSDARAICVTAIFTVLLFLLLGGKRCIDRTFDGVVTDKRLRRVTTLEGKRGVDADRYMLFVTDSNGKVHETSIVESTVSADRANAGEIFSRKADAIEYFRRGDRVRHHAGMKMYEKEDKSKDRTVLCCACLTITDISHDNCRSCGLPLLK